MTPRLFFYLSALTAILLVTLFLLTSSPVAEAANVLDQPVAFDLCTPEGGPATQKCMALNMEPSYQVPAGSRLVIEQVSGECSWDGETGQFVPRIVAQTGGVTVAHGIIGVPQPPLPTGLVPLTLTRIYADPNSSVTIELTSIPAGPNGRFCRVAFSGLLVKP